MQERTKIKIPIKTYLVCLVILTFFVTSVSLSRYIMRVEGGDSARVAKYIVEINMQKDFESVELQLDDIMPGESHDYEFAVANNDGANRSEVAFSFYIELTTTALLPLEITISEGVNVYEYNHSEEKIITDIYYIGTSSNQTVEFLITFAWDAEENDAIYQGLTDTISINVFWEQLL